MLLAALLGAFGSGARLSLSGGSIVDDDLGIAGLASARLIIHANGTVRAVGIGSDFDIALNSDTDWIRPVVLAPNYYVRATLQSGLPPSGPTLGQWHSTAESRQWELSRSSPGIDFAELLIEIGADQSTAIVSGVYNLFATVQ